MRLQGVTFEKTAVEWDPRLRPVSSSRARLFFREEVRSANASECVRGGYVLKVGCQERYVVDLTRDELWRLAKRWAPRGRSLRGYATLLRFAREVGALLATAGGAHRPPCLRWYAKDPRGVRDARRRAAAR